MSRARLACRLLAASVPSSAAKAASEPPCIHIVQSCVPSALRRPANGLSKVIQQASGEGSAE